MVVDGVTQVSSNELGPVVSLIAKHDNAVITFSGSASTFNAIVAQADDGVSASVDIDATSGVVYLDGDTDETLDTASRIDLSSGRTLKAETLLTLAADTGVIVGAGATTLKANSGIIFLSGYNVSVSGSNPLVINANSYADDGGTLTIAAARTVSSNNNHITISSWDIDFQGSLSAETEGILVLPAFPSQTVGIGDTSKNLHLHDAELGRMTSRAGLTIGSNKIGDVYVDGVTDANSVHLGTTTLIANKPGRSVTFETGASSFNKGIIIQAGAGIIFAESLSSKASADVMSAGTGTLTIATAKSLSTTNQFLTITANDIDMQGTGTLDSGPAASITLHCTTNERIVGLGSGSGQLSIDTSEVLRITSGGMTIGNPTCSRQFVQNVDFSAVDGIVTLITEAEDTQVSFLDIASTFTSLNVQADNGVIVSVDLTSTAGELYLDADLEDSSSSDGSNSIWFSGARNILAKEIMTLEEPIS